MLKYMGNNKGVALLIVMVIMSVLVIVGSLMLTMSSSESRMVYDYGNNNRAFYLAEAGVDLAIGKWADYVDGLPRDIENQDDPDLLLGRADILDFKTLLEAAGEDLVQKFRNNNNYNNQEVYITYTEYQPDSEELDYSSDTVKNILQIKVEGKYEKAVYEYIVKLWYDRNGNTEAEKGSGEPKEPPILTLSADPVGGLYNTPQSVTLTASKPATIYFTIDGSEPTQSSEEYSGPISIISNTTLKFMAIDSTGIESNIYTEEYIIDKILPTVNASPSGGQYNTPQSVTLTASKQSAKIYFTIDGSEPTQSSSEYTEPISISHNTMLKFMAVDLAGNRSEIYTENYLIVTDPPTVCSTDPTDGATNIPVDKIIKVTFSEAVQEGANYNSIILRDNTGNQIAATISIDDKVLSINPNNNLAYSTEFTVIIPVGAVKDMESNPLSSSEGFSFTTMQSSGGGSGGDYVLYTNSVVFSNQKKVKGNVLIGNGANMVTINGESDFWGNVYINTNLTVDNRSFFGKPTQPVQLVVEGSVIFHPNVDIYGDFFYQGNLTINNHLYVSGQQQKKTVNNPQINLPELKTEQWYADNSYTIVTNNAWPWIELEDNGKYFFKTSYAFDNNSHVDNIIIACAGDITFYKEFKGSGIIFAPNGTVTFDKNCDFTGFIISKAAVFHGQTDLTYYPYTNLPY